MLTGRSNYSVGTTYRMKHTMNSMKTNSRTFVIDHPNKNALERAFLMRQQGFDTECEVQVDINTMYTVMRTRVPPKKATPKSYASSNVYQLPRSFNRHTVEVM